MRIETRTIYVSDDGREFDNDRKDCEQQMMEELARHNQDAEFMTGLAAVQSRAML